MYLPISFEGTIPDYNNLLKGVQLWDVGVERQIQIKGPDAEALSQFLSPRNIKKCSIGQACPIEHFLIFLGLKNCESASASGPLI